MMTGFCLRFWLALTIALPAAAAESPAERELIQDSHFNRGFILWNPKPGSHVRYGDLPGTETNAAPVWGLSQWSSKFPLAAGPPIRTPDSALIYSNAAKAVVLGQADSPRADISMAVNTGAEYSPRSRNAGEPWVHLLVEQEFEPTTPLAALQAAKLHVEARLLRTRRLPMENYSPGIHAAQFQIFFTVQNRNPKSPGFGDLVWFGVPIYDDRSAFPPEFKERDFGGTGKFIFTPDGKTYSSVSAHDGQWLVIDKDLLPLMREALATAWSRGFLTGSKEFSDYHIGGMNMGWELPGSFDVEMQIRNLSLKAIFNDAVSK
jgi:hypothetical protein